MKNVLDKQTAVTIVFVAQWIQIFNCCVYKVRSTLEMEHCPLKMHHLKDSLIVSMYIDCNEYKRP